MKNFFTFLLGISLFVVSSAQTPQLNWAKSFNGKSGSTDSSSVMKMNILDNSIYIAGSSDAYGNANDIVLIKRDYTTGDTLWTRHYNGPANADDQSVDLAINQITGDIYVTGKSMGISTGYDIVTLKYSSSGTFGWAARWDNIDYHGDDVPVNIGIDDNGKIYVSSRSFNGSYGLFPRYNDVLVLVYNSESTLMNFSIVNVGINYDENVVQDAIVNSNGDVIVAGESVVGTPTNGYSTSFVGGFKSNLSSFYPPNSWSGTGPAFVGTSLNMNGWVSAPDDFNYYNAMDMDNSKNVYIATLGDTIYKSGSYYQILFEKINSSGTVVWKKKTGGNPNSGNLRVNALKVDANNLNMYAAGYELNSIGNFDWFVIKYNSSGVLQWRVTKKGTGNGNDIAYQIAFDEFQNPIVVGVTKNTGTNNDITFVKYNKTNGNEIFSVNYDSNNSDEKAYNIIVDANQIIIINGIENTAAQSQNIITLRYCNLPSAAGVISGETNICQGQNSIHYTVPQIENATSYIWTLPNGASGTSTTNSISVIYGSSSVSGNITVKGNNSCGDGTSFTLPVVVNIKPTTPIVTLNENKLHSNVATGNQWYNQTGAIDGATIQDYTPITTGNYYTVVSINGCSSASSNSINFIPTGIDLTEYAKSINVYPNPVSNELVIEFEGNSTQTNFEILNSLGQTVFNGTIFEKTVVQTSSFTPGVYLVKLDLGKTFEFKKIIKD